MLNLGFPSGIFRSIKKVFRAERTDMILPRIRSVTRLPLSTAIAPPPPMVGSSRVVEPSRESEPLQSSTVTSRRRPGYCAQCGKFRAMAGASICYQCNNE